MSKVRSLLNLSLLGLMLIQMEAYAESSISLSAGGYSLDASGGSRSFSKSGPGSYRLSYSKRIYRGFHLSGGYNLIFESGIGGDQSYGLDLGISWSFLTDTLRQETYVGDTSLIIQSIWSPYVGFSFNQRSYQSSRSSYSGVGLCLGSHFPWLDRISYLVEVRANSLSGPSQSTVSEKSLLLGVNYYF